MADTQRAFLPFESGALDWPSSCLIIRAGQDLTVDPNSLLIEQGFKPVADALQAKGYTVTPSADGRFSMVIVILTRSRAENLANIARACAMAETSVIVSGAKTDGMDSLVKAVKARVTLDGVQSKSHGKVMWFPPFPAEDWQIGGQITKNADGYLTCPGVFSADRIDPGSALLLEHLPAKLSGEWADLGAGWGYLSAQLLGNFPTITHLDLFEAEHLALTCAKQNVSDPRARFHWADVHALPKSMRYDGVIMNPPFHHDRAADPALGKGFIQAAARLLKPGGQMLCVANRQLPYESTLDQYFRHWEIVAQTGVYKVVHAKRPNSRNVL